MATPKLTIKVNGVPVGGLGNPTTDLKDRLYMAYFQAAKGETRHQWIVFPPPVEEVLPEYDQARDRQLTLSRTQTFVGNRARWSPSYIRTTTQLESLLSDLVEQGFDIGSILVVPLEEDDFKKAYDHTTPEKAIRAIDRLLESVYNSSIK